LTRKSWTRDELLLTFNLYCRTPFGRLHRNNPDIIALAQKLGRTSSAVAMKLVNFASFDPAHQSRNVRGLSNAYESQQAYNRLLPDFAPDAVSERWLEEFLRARPTEGKRLVRVRLVQGFFRDAVLSSYEYRCAMCLLDLPELLNASHIIPWKDNVARRADPRNGLALCSIHDRAFDRGFLTVTETHQMLTSVHAKKKTPCRLHQVALLDVEGQALTLPKRFLPDEEALAYHRKHIFKK
jgi:putative restriction endonuclease